MNCFYRFFSDRLKWVMRSAKQEANIRMYEYIDTEHVLIALIN